MPTEIDRAGVRRLMAQAAPIIEVLPHTDYAQEHLPGAINLPLTQLDARTSASLVKEHPVVVYCHDLQ